MTILGSPRRKGNTAKVLGWIEKQFRAEGHEVTSVNMLDHDVQGCGECLSCKKASKNRQHPLLLSPGNAEASVGAAPDARQVPVAHGGTGDVRSHVPGTATKDTVNAGIWPGWIVCRQFAVVVAAAIPIGTCPHWMSAANATPARSSMPVMRRCNATPLLRYCSPISFLTVGSIDSAQIV